MSIITQTSLSANTPDILLRNVPCAAAVAVGDWVRIDSTLNTAVKALADAKVNSLVLGLVEAKTSSTSANIRTFGLSDIVFSGLSVNDEYVLSQTVSGGMMPRSGGVPTGPGQVIAPLGMPLNPTRFVVRITNRMVRA